MRYGLGVSDDHPLEQKHRGQPDLIAKLREIEARAFERTNRVADLKRIAGVDEDDEQQPEQKPVVKAKKPVKQKIVDTLKAKASKKTAPKATEKAAAKATVTAKSSPAKKRR